MTKNKEKHRFAVLYVSRKINWNNCKPSTVTLVFAETFQLIPGVFSTKIRWCDIQLSKNTKETPFILALLEKFRQGSLNCYSATIKIIHSLQTTYDTILAKPICN